MKNPAYEIADAILSGRAVPVAGASLIEFDNSRRELKTCEFCPRNFVRPIGSKRHYCDGCAWKARRRVTR